MIAVASAMIGSLIGLATCPPGDAKSLNKIALTRNASDHPRRIAMTAERGNSPILSLGKLLPSGTWRS